MRRAITAGAWGLVLSGSVACSLEHDACGGIDGPSCALGLECVSTMLCAIGPCPGTCLAACAGEGDCATDETCATPEGWDDQQRYCVLSGS